MIFAVKRSPPRIINGKLPITLTTLDLYRYISTTTRAVVRVDELHQKDFDELGSQINDWTMRAVTVQLKLFEKADYGVEAWGDGTYTVTSTKTKQFYVDPCPNRPHPGAGIMRCSCMFNGSHGLPCRHIMVVNFSEDRAVARSQNCLTRRTRGAPDAEFVTRGPIDHVSEIANLDEEEMDEERTKKLNRHQRWAEVRKVSKQLVSKLVDVPPDLFWQHLEIVSTLPDQFIEKIENEVDSDQFGVQSSFLSILLSNLPVADTDGRGVLDPKLELPATERPRGRPRKSKGLHNAQFNRKEGMDESVGQRGTKRKRASAEGDVDLEVAFIVNNHRILKTEAARIEGAQTLSPSILRAMTALFDKTGASGFIELDELYSLGFKGLEKNGTICIQVHFNDVNHFFTSM